MANKIFHSSGFFLLLSLACIEIVLSACIKESLAQIIPDNTLGHENSLVTNVNPGVNRLDGGAIRGSNLFHSFQEFNISPRQSAYFSNPTAINNIFSRVTGVNPSYLFGTLGVLGDANLYFLNPNGVIFGPNANLDLRGSLITSTADDFIFINGEKFGVSQPQVPSLLTINTTAPIGLQIIRSTPGPIITSATLEVDKHLTLVGGTITSTGHLHASQGNVSIATVKGPIENETATVVPISDSGQTLGQSTQPLSLNTQRQTVSTTTPLLADLVAASREHTGLNVDSAGHVMLAASGIPVDTGDIVITGLNAQTAELSAAHNLTLENSQLSTADDLSLNANNIVFIRDSTQFPLSIMAGGNLLIQGTQGIDLTG